MAWSTTIVLVSSLFEQGRYPLIAAWTKGELQEDHCAASLLLPSSNKNLGNVIGHELGKDQWLYDQHDKGHHQDHKQWAIRPGNALSLGALLGRKDVTGPVC
jgi:hypothetical protein